MIKKITSDDKKLECYKLLVMILQAEKALRQLKILLKTKSDDILKSAGPEYSLTEDFDCVKEGVDFASSSVSPSSPVSD